MCAVSLFQAGEDRPGLAEGGLEHVCIALRGIEVGVVEGATRTCGAESLCADRSK